MSEAKDFPKGVFLLGLVLLLAGAMLMLSAADVLQTDNGNIHGPRWVGFLAGLMFFNAGVMVYMMDGNLNAFRQMWWFGYLQGAALFSIPLILLILFNWVAFGPGEREFSVSVSIPFISAYFERSNELIGRAVFGIPTLLVDAVLAGAIFKAGYDKVLTWINEGEEENLPGGQE